MAGEQLQIYETTPKRREQLFLAPMADFQTNRDLIYSGQVELRIGRQSETLFKSEDSIERHNTRAVLGGAFGDEGKGRIIDNLIEDLLDHGAQTVYVIRYQG